MKLTVQELGTPVPATCGSERIGSRLPIFREYSASMVDNLVIKSPEEKDPKKFIIPCNMI